MEESTDRELLELARNVGVADVMDAMGRLHRHHSHMVDLSSPMPDRLLFGPVVTMSFFPSCQDALPSETFNFVNVFDRAVREGGRGRVLVMASNGYPGVSLGGGTKMSRLVGHGLCGVLADGRLRDFGQRAELGLAVYCRGEAFRWGGDKVTPVEANRPVVVGGVAVRPGDYVFARGSGAVIIPRTQVLEVLTDAKATMDNEAAVAEGWKRDPADG